MNNNKVIAIIILFKPEYDVLNLLLDSVVEQVEKILIIDNTPDPQVKEIEKLIIKFGQRTQYVPLFDNVGIAAAQNVGIKMAKDSNASHVLLLDQDSILPEKMVEGLLSEEASLLSKGVSVAAIGPSYIDQKTNESVSAVEASFLRTKRKSHSGTNEPLHSDYIIASGSLIRVDVLNKYGLMREELFIDWVDIEWGERCRVNNCYSFVSQNVIMKHSIGDEHANILGKTIYLHSDFRNYFIVRNAVYLSKDKGLRLKLRFSMLFKVPYYIILFSLLSKSKFYSMKLLSRAALDGMRNNMGKGYFK